MGLRAIGPPVAGSAFVILLIAVFATGATAGEKEGVTPGFPPRIDCIQPNATVIGGWLSVDAKPGDFRVERNYEPLATEGEPEINHQTGRFSIKLKKPAGAGNAIRVVVVGSLAAVQEVGACEAQSAASNPPRPAHESKRTPPQGSPPTFAKIPAAGDDRIQGSVCEPAQTVQLTIDGTDLPGATAKVGARREFEIELPNEQRVKPKQKIVVKPDAGPPSEEVEVQPASNSERPTVAEPMEGDKMVTGSAEGFGHVMVTVYDHREAFVEQKKGEVDATAGTFTVGLSRAVSEGDSVRVIGLKGDGADVQKSGPVRVPVQPADYNWGRNRMYFSLGALTSNQDSDFQKVRPYLSLNFDTNWIRHVICYEVDLRLNESDRAMLAAKYPGALQNLKAAKIPVNAQKLLEELSPEGRQLLQGEIDEWGQYQRREDLRTRCDLKPFREAWAHILLNSYAEFRLQNSQSLALNELKTETLKNGKRASAFEFGMYLPINLARTSWWHESRRQALFFAPIGKGGMESIPKPDGAASDAGYGIFKYWAGGLRLGHYLVLPHSESHAPELISWVDLTLGKWDRFRSESAPERSLTRFEATGRVKIPYTPVTMGFSTNTGSGPDEFTFFAGTRFDVGKILSKISPSVK